MQQENFSFTYSVFPDDAALTTADKTVLEFARQNLAKAYAPYSKFHVAAVALLKNGEMVLGTNQENASYPVGICAERVLLASAAMLFPETSVQTIAITYLNKSGTSDHPISPCGMCRQYMAEYESRQKQPIRILLSGLSGKVILVESVSLLLPLAFGSEDLNR